MRRFLCVVFIVVLFCAPMILSTSADTSELDVVITFTLPESAHPGDPEMGYCDISAVIVNEKIENFSQLDVMTAFDTSIFSVWEGEPLWDEPWDPDIRADMEYMGDGCRTHFYLNPDRYPNAFVGSVIGKSIGGLSCKGAVIRRKVDANEPLKLGQTFGTLWLTDGSCRPAVIEVRTNFDQIETSFDYSRDNDLYIVRFPAEEPQNKPTRWLDPSFFWGDADGDTKVTARDARTILRASAQLESLDNVVIYRCDVDHDRRLTARDARKILRVSARLETI